MCSNQFYLNCLKMRIKEITAFWNNLVAVFGLSILSSTKQTWKIGIFKTFWAVITTLLFLVWGFYQCTDQNSHSIINHKNHPKPVFINSTIIIFIIIGGNINVNWIRLSYLIQSKKVIELYDRVIQFDEKHFGTSLVLWKSHTFRFLFFGFFVLICFLIFDFCLISDSKGIIMGSYVYPAYFIVLNGQMSVFLIWIRNILDRIQKDYLMDLESGFIFAENYLCKMPRILKNRLFPVRIVKQARKLYHELYMISRLLNEVYAAPVLIMLWHNFMLSIIYTYACIYNIRYEDQDKLDVFPLHWAMLSFVASLAIVHPFHSTSHKASFLVVNVQGLLSKFDDDRLNCELQQFAIQVQQERMDFSPYGLFVIQNSILPEIISAVATYLVVLTQFKIPM